MCSTANVATVRSLRADRVIDPARLDFTQDQAPYVVVLDAVDKLDPSKGKGRRNPRGVYLNTVKDSVLRAG